MANTCMFSDVIHSSSVKVKSSKLGRLKARWLVLKQRSSTGPPRVELYKNEQMLDEPRCVIETQDITNVTCEDASERAVQVRTSTGKSLHLSFDRVDDCHIWLELLNRQRKSMIRDVILLPGHAAQRYYSPLVNKNSLAVFNVYLLPTNGVAWAGESLLQLNETSLSLHDVYNPTIVHVTWTLNTLRRYGSNATSFNMETGRSSATGEGMVIFNTTQGAEIHRKVHQATVALRSALAITRTQQLEKERLEKKNSSNSYM